MSVCQLCGSSENVASFDVAGVENCSVEICSICKDQINSTDNLDVHHWRCLNDSMWTPDEAVQIMAWQMLNRLSLQGENWAQDALDSLYLEEDVLVKAQAAAGSDDEDTLKHIDSNGAVLAAGDTVVLIKDLNVKGAGFTAKRGTAVRNISLDPTNAAHIEGRVNGQQIVILTKFVKKS
ncbi:PhnA domain-containing protein [Terasakiella sp. A23]|uniref:PhnA domain-containing protein n=1 Tax=Terasakiella sp. FCG-A23 TaxID=3080561 RepID=UPI0029535B05|nr:PhnA domain-containing protein [Terasakiella sp. A23]MDV7340680.1 PhnA domain-containing protein [Terasakiella sp. A23]